MHCSYSALCVLCTVRTVHSVSAVHCWYSALCLLCTVHTVHCVCYALFVQCTLCLLCTVSTMHCSYSALSVTVHCANLLFSASHLDHVVYRMGLLAVLRSKCKRGRSVVRMNIHYFCILSLNRE